MTDKVEKIEGLLVRKNVYQASLTALKVYQEQLQDQYIYVRGLGEPSDEDFLDSIASQVEVIGDIINGFEAAMVDKNETVPGQGFH